MNNTNHYLHDIELPATGLPYFIWVLLVITALFLIFIIVRYAYQRQHPLAQAKRQLHILSTTQAHPQIIAKWLQQGLQVQRLSDSSLPKDFLQRLDQARFSAEPCTLSTFLSLKEEARLFLEQQQ